MQCAFCWPSRSISGKPLSTTHISFIFSKRFTDVYETQTPFVSFVLTYFYSSDAIRVWKFRNIFQNRKQEMVAHELQCLLCKLPVECKKGATDLLQQHLRRDHEVVRWARVLLGKRKGQVFQVWGRLVASPVSSEQGREGGYHKTALPQVELFAKVFKASHYEV